VARKAGLGTNDVINAWPLEDVGAVFRHSQAEAP
jgi:hypothetical protein